MAYLVTGATLLPALDDRYAVRKLKEHGRYGEIVDYLASAIWSSGVLLMMTILVGPVVSVLGFARSSNGLYSSAWWGLLIYAVAADIRAIGKILKLLLVK